MGISVLANYNTQINGEFRKIRVYKGLISHPKTWVGTNCVCDLFLPLRDLKPPEALDSEVKHSASKG